MITIGDDLAIETGLSLPTIRIIRTLNQLFSVTIIYSEFISREFLRLATENSILIKFIQSGKNT